MDHVLLENHAWTACGDCCLGWVVGMGGGGWLDGSMDVDGG